MFAVFFFDMDGVNTDVVSVQDTKPCCNDLPVYADAGANGFFENCLWTGTVYNN